jgi:hypothetical protein
LSHVAFHYTDSVGTRDLGGDFGKVECICGHSLLIPHSGLQLGLRLPLYMPGEAIAASIPVSLATVGLQPAGFAMRRIVRYRTLIGAPSQRHGTNREQRRSRLKGKKGARHGTHPRCKCLPRC